MLRVTLCALSLALGAGSLQAQSDITSLRSAAAFTVMPPDSPDDHP